MYVISQLKKEELTVIHNNLNDRENDIKQLVKEGWEHADHEVYTMNVPEEYIEEFKSDCPDVEIVYPSKNSLLHAHPYVYKSKLERVID